MNTEECLNLFPALKIFPSQKVGGSLIITHRILHICVGLPVGFETSKKDWLKI